MRNPFTASDWISATVSVAWYAAPDFIPDHRIRIWTKVGLGLSGTALLAWHERDKLREARNEITTSHDIAQRLDSGDLAPDDPEVTGFLDDMSSNETGRSGLAVAGIASMAVVILGSEVAMRRLSKRQRARGVRRPHLLGALLRGALALGQGPVTRRLEQLDARALTPGLTAATD